MSMTADVIMNNVCYDKTARVRDKVKVVLPRRRFKEAVISS